MLHLAGALVFLFCNVRDLLLSQVGLPTDVHHPSYGTFMNYLCYTSISSHLSGGGGRGQLMWMVH